MYWNEEAKIVEYATNEINNNMRCIEIWIRHWDAVESVGINNNMRCIEMFPEGVKDVGEMDKQ